MSDNHFGMFTYWTVHAITPPSHQTRNKPSTFYDRRKVSILLICMLLEDINHWLFFFHDRYNNPTYLILSVCWEEGSVGAVNTTVVVKTIRAETGCKVDVFFEVIASSNYRGGGGGRG